MNVFFYLDKRPGLIKIKIFFHLDERPMFIKINAVSSSR